MKSEQATQNEAANRINGVRWRWAIAAIVFSLTTKLMTIGPLTWLTKGYGHDFATPVLVYMVTRSHFSSAPICAAVTAVFFALSEAFQFFQFLIPGHSPGRFGVFDPWDIVAFTLGTCLAFGIDTVVSRRAARSNKGGQ